MSTEKQVIEILLWAFEHLRSQREAISVLQSEVYALRDSLCAIGPEYASILSHHREASIASDAPFASEDLRRLDAIIQRLRDGRIP